MNKSENLPKKMTVRKQLTLDDWQIQIASAKYIRPYNLIFNAKCKQIR